MKNFTVLLLSILSFSYATSLYASPFACLNQWVNDHQAELGAYGVTTGKTYPSPGFTDIWFNSQIQLNHCNSGLFLTCNGIPPIGNKIAQAISSCGCDDWFTGHLNYSESEAVCATAGSYKHLDHKNYQIIK